MSRWFRFYDDAINDPKVLKLSERHYRTWIGLLCVASKNGGSLPSLDDCALMIRMQPERMAEAVVALVGAGLLQRDGEVLSLSDWNTRQYKSDVSTERSQRYRQQQRNVAATAEQRRGNGPEQREQNRACNGRPDQGHRPDRTPRLGRLQPRDHWQAVPSQLPRRVVLPHEVATRP